MLNYSAVTDLNKTVIKFSYMFAPFDYIITRTFFITFITKCIIKWIINVY